MTSAFFVQAGVKIRYLICFCDWDFWTWYELKKLSCL